MGEKIINELKSVGLDYSLNSETGNEIVKIKTDNTTVLIAKGENEKYAVNVFSVLDSEEKALNILKAIDKYI